MNFRRLIAAATTLLFLTIWCGPAFAGMRELVSPPEKEGCCCSKEVTTTHETVQDIPCRCASCACSLGDGQPFVPLTATASVPSMTTALIATPAVLDLTAVPPHRAVSTVAARGPPTTESPPLYLLYDTWLI